MYPVREFDHIWKVLAKLFIKFYRLLLVPVVLMIRFLYPVSVSVSGTGNFGPFRAVIILVSNFQLSFRPLTRIKSNVPFIPSTLYP
jgi:hypothetical protein